MQVLKNQLNSPRLRDLRDEDYHDTVVNLMAEIKMLNGALLHKSEVVGGVNLLKQQVETIKMMLASNFRFSALTVSELRHAFFLNAQGEYDEVYKHYNRELNAEFVGQVLRAYLQYRRPLDVQAEAIKGKLRGKLLLPVAVPCTDDWKRIVQRHYDLYRNGDWEMIFVYPGEYYFLRKIEAIRYTSKKKWGQWYLRALNDRFAEAMARDAVTYEEKEEKERRRSMYIRILDTGIVPPDEDAQVICRMRKMVVMKLFELLADCNIHNLWDDVAWDYTRLKRRWYNEK